VVVGVFVIVGIGGLGEVVGGVKVDVGVTRIFAPPQADKVNPKMIRHRSAQLNRNLDPFSTLVASLYNPGFFFVAI
jgi:hypothetical protein